ncbi:MAG: transposase [Planctomycetaceae bacterium]
MCCHEVRRAQIERINGLNEFLIDAFVRTRKQMPKRVIIDLDPTDDTAHGKQQLTFWHGYYDQNQYFPMMIFEGGTGMPLAAWLRPGTVHASCGAVDMLKLIVDRLRQHWPDLVISVRGDSGVAGPEMYDYCEAEGFEYAFGYATNDTPACVKELELEENAKLLWWMTGRRGFQLFHTFDDYQAGSWPHARRIITKVEFTKLGGLNATANVKPGDEYERHFEGYLSWLLHSARSRAGASDRRTEEWPAHGSTELTSLPLRMVITDGAHAGVSAVRVVSRSSV